MLEARGGREQSGSVTAQGGVLRKMPLPPRLAQMVLRSAEYGKALEAAKLALLVTERGLGGNDIDLSVRLDGLSRNTGKRSERALKAAASMVKPLSHADRSMTESTKHDDLSPGAMLSFAWPERIARRTGPPKGETVQYLLANGRRALLDGLVSLAREEWLAVCEIQGSAASGRILSAAPLALEEIETFHYTAIVSEREVSLEEAGQRYRAFKVKRLGQITISRENAPLETEDDIPGRIIAHMRKEGLGNLLADDEVANLRNRMSLLNATFPDRFKAVDDKSLIEQLEEWLLPLLGEVAGPADLTSSKLCDALKLYTGYANAGEMDRLAPNTIALPSGHSHRLDYGSDGVTLRARVQEFFGLTQHPAICDGRVPVVLELLSPAQRPIQKTLDIAGFWSGSWVEVRKEMRGRYPKHFWPEDPAHAQATTRTKPRR